MATSAELLQQQYYHATLPRNVPGKSDRNSYQVELALLDRFIDALKSIIPFTPLEHQSRVDVVRVALTTSRALNVEGKIDKTSLVKELQALGRDHALILYVTEQNAALLVYRISTSGEDDLAFEAFETSAVCDKVLAVEGALIWDFPGNAVTVPHKVYTDETFQESVATFLEQSSIESVKHFAAVTHKAAAPMPEIRDTTNPALITGLFMSILEANGAKYTPEVLQKRVRDTVSFKEAHKPWRRSPFYLILRVAVQRLLYRLLGADVGRVYYKVVMCIYLSRLLDDTLNMIPSEDVQFLKQKLGRRLAKLAHDKAVASVAAKEIQEGLFYTLDAVFNKSLSTAGRFLAQQWASYRTNTKRIVRYLPNSAAPSALFLKLPLSGQYLNNIAFANSNMFNNAHVSPLQLLQQYESTGAIAKPFAAVAERYLTLADAVEHKFSPAFTKEDNKGATWDSSCSSISRSIHMYIKATGTLLNGYAELKSGFLLDLMELWVEMDRSATAEFPLLKQYHPGFDPEMLDILELLPLEHMDRVQCIQVYLRRRCLGWAGTGSRTIFDPPAEDSFSVLYYDDYGDEEGLKKLRRKIETDAEKSREAKEEEWRELSEKHEALMQRVAESTCPYVTTITPEGRVERVHQRGCLKHRFKWEANQIKIKVFENPLPEAEPDIKAVIFELACPKTFANYRDATWLLLSTLAYPKSKHLEHVPSLRSYSGLQRYAKPLKIMVSLGSSTKSHLDCHYSESGFPVALHQICRPCGLTLSYFDRNSESWTTRSTKPSFSMHCMLQLPKDSPYRSLALNENWPSSNDAISSQSKCPADVNVHEFMAWQGLFGGTHRRWLSLLRELGATNLNLSSESTWAIITKLIYQIGPSSSGDELRDVHQVFVDEDFCARLLEQISYRVDSIKRNWREPVQMDILISMLLKIESLSSFETKAQAFSLLMHVRSITWDWCSLLHTSTANSSGEVTNFAIWASVLCKRTYQCLSAVSSRLTSTSLSSFIGASITLEENLVGDFSNLPHNLGHAVIRDLQFTYRIRDLLRHSILADPKAFLSVLNTIWPLPQTSVESPPRVEAVPETFWIQVSVKGHQGMHYIHFHLVRGDLIIDGKQSGNLPSEYRKYPIIQHLFGTYNLRVRPSNQPGMSLFIQRPMPNNHWVHVGSRNGELVVRATRAPAVLELISDKHFHRGTQFDLPNSLIINCYHWLDLGTKELEIRQDDVWTSKKSNWRLDLRSSRAYRRGSTLVDPYSPVALKIAQNLHFFEFAYNITVFQPLKGPLSVELKRLELSFFINHAKLLQCRELGAEVAPSEEQDFGSWYGLRSKIVLRSVQNHNQRLILVPQGASKTMKDGSHVKSVIDNTGGYLKFEINSVLGRIECPAEPRLLYTKALWHAKTTSFLPDPLTGRTGLEEALYLLQTGLYKPWTPLHPGVHDLLNSIARLSPQRVYYPTSLKCMETVDWNPDMTITMQDDRYRAIVELICQRSMTLQLFELGGSDDKLQAISAGDPHLETRAVRRSGAKCSTRDETYSSRDRRISNHEHSHVLAISQLLVEWPTNLVNTTHIASLLEKYPVIGGYIGAFDRVQIFDLISVHLGENWGSLVQSAIESGPQDRYRLMFLFAPMVLSADAPMELLQVLLSYAIIPSLKNFAHPKAPSYLRFRSNETPAAKDMAELMKDAHQPYEPPLAQKGYRPGQLALERIKHEEACEFNTLLLAKTVRAQWPQSEVDSTKLATVDEKFLIVESALEPVLTEWKRLALNYEFSQYLDKVQGVLNKHSDAISPQDSDDKMYDGFATDPPQPKIYYPIRNRGAEPPDLQNLLTKSIYSFKAPVHAVPVAAKEVDTLSSALQQLPNGITSQKSHVAKNAASRPAHIKELDTIVKELVVSGSAVQQDYGRELQHSIEALLKQQAEPSITLAAWDSFQLSRDIQLSHASCVSMLHDIYEALEAGDERAKWLKHAGLWPKLSKLELLSEIRSTSGTVFGAGTKEALVEFGLELTALQRLLRIQDASLKNKQQQLKDERANHGHSNWSPLDHTDWLLLEIDSDLMLRAEQIEVAQATISPSSGQNSVVQLLMGKGKTSCILPMVAAVLADTKNLLRIVVPRPLLLQSAQVMQIKLGGLLDREVMHIPFSRRTSTSRYLMQPFSQLHFSLRKASGVMISLPEHILSFKLSGLQRLCDGSVEEAKPMIKIQDWLESYARDVLDECDVSLAIRTQLIYPSGSQMTVDGHPLRWQTIEAVIRLVRAYLPHLQRLYPQSIEVVERVIGDFPLVYFLRPDVEKYLLTIMVEDICKGQLSTFPCAEIPASYQADIRTFISESAVTTEVEKRIAKLFHEKQHLLKVLYLLRGLFVHRIFLSTLKKRWNVQYGLHPDRDPIAVPYHAKGVPSTTSEWGHPDVAIILTCLSFYYEGLNEVQFKQSFEQLLKSDEPSIEFEKWATPDLPASLRDYNAINVEDSSQLRELHQHVRYNVYLLDFFMNSFVFPRHAKQFDTKLQASGWDLVLYDPTCKARARTTGFSGTNDSRHQLPMMIKQNDLPKLAHTNAEVLSYLLYTRNRQYIRMVDIHGHRLSETGLLQKMLNPYNKLIRDNRGDLVPDPGQRIRVLIDAGAQILEHDNRSLAKAWLTIDTSAAAAVFFESDHRPWVLYRKGTTVPLVASPFVENLGDCLVYLDESHCRGTDLKLPPSARAALTLGPHVTKDALAQAAMRLRLLGQSQAVTFFAPPEVHQSILDLRYPQGIKGTRNGLGHEFISSTDVISWLLRRSCDTIEQLEPLYFTQGNTYMQHVQSKIDNPEILERSYQLERFLSTVRSKEIHTLKQLYEPKRRAAVVQSTSFIRPLQSFVAELTQRKKAFQDRGFAVHASALEEVEQEREVEFEVESVREAQKPVHFNALKIPRIHKDIEEFAKTGLIFHGSNAYQPMFSALQQTASGLKHGTFSISSQAPGLFVSTQSNRTVKVVEPNDNFLRPCHWVLWSTRTEIAMIVSPEEADALIPLLRRYRGPKSQVGSTHLIVYSAPVTRRMLHFNGLTYHATPALPRNFKIPGWVKIELGIFAGRLYFSWEEYEELAAYLGVQTSTDTSKGLELVKREAFVKKPLTFLHEWLAVLRKGADFEHTPMGFITTGKPLSADHPFFLESDNKEATAEPKLKQVFFGAPEDEVEDEGSDSDDDQDEVYHGQHYEHGSSMDVTISDDDEETNDFFDADEYIESGLESDDEPDA